MNKCVDCNKVIDDRSERCCTCAQKHRAKDVVREVKVCIDCGKPLARQFKSYKKLRCKKCARQLRVRNHKFVKYKCVDCGKELTKKSSKRCKSCANKGINNPGYIHGKAYEPYALIFNKKLKLEIRERDNFKCLLCGITEVEHLMMYGRVLTIHHIDYNKKNCDKGNLATNCRQCNTRDNFNRDYWTEYFRSKVYLCSRLNTPNLAKKK